METAGLLLVGCGKMGGAMLAGWLGGDGAPTPVVVVEPQPAPDAIPPGRHDLAVVATADAIPAQFRPQAVVLATKPQIMDDVVPAYARFAGAGTVFLSVAAGRPLSYFAQRLGDTAAIVRAMPNTPAQVGRGIAACCANGVVSQAQRDLADRLLRAVGEVCWIEDEALMDAVTAVSGSGPAYAFLLAECMTEAGRAAGLPEELAARLARATVAGAGELLHRSAETAGQLRRNVTSPNGTTAAALAVLMAADGLQPLMTRAVAAAARRSRELAG